MVEFTLEPLTEANGDFRLAVYRATIKPSIDALFGWDDATQERIIRNQLQAGTHAAIVIDGERVGILQLEESAETIALSQIEILPQFQGRGIGSAVIRSLMIRSDQEGKPLTLHVFTSNTTARRLYERLGLRVTGEVEHGIEMTYRPAQPT